MPKNAVSDTNLQVRAIVRKHLQKLDIQYLRLYAEKRLSGSKSNIAGHSLKFYCVYATHQAQRATRFSPLVLVQLNRKLKPLGVRAEFHFNNRFSQVQSLHVYNRPT